MRASQRYSRSCMLFGPTGSAADALVAVCACFFGAVYDGRRARIEGVGSDTRARACRAERLRLDPVRVLAPYRLEPATFGGASHAPFAPTRRRYSLTIAIATVFLIVKTLSYLGIYNPSGLSN